MTMETIIFLLNLNHMSTYCITVDLGNIMLKCKYRVRIEQLFDRKSVPSSRDMSWENQPELPSDKGSNWSRGATRDIGSLPLFGCNIFIKQLFNINPVNSNLQVSLNVKNNEYRWKWWQSWPITGLKPTTSVITGQRFNQCATAVSIYIDLH